MGSVMLGCLTNLVTSFVLSAAKSITEGFTLLLGRSKEDRAKRQILKQACEQACERLLQEEASGLDRRMIHVLKTVTTQLVNCEEAAGIFINAAMRQCPPDTARLSLILEGLGYSSLGLPMSGERIIESIADSVQICALQSSYTHDNPLQNAMQTALLTQVKTELQDFGQCVLANTEINRTEPVHVPSQDFWELFLAARKYLREFDVNRASRILEDIKLRHWSDCSPDQQSQVLAELARAYELSGKIEDGARMRFQAADLVRGTRAGQFQEAFALAQLGENDKAFAIAEIMIQERPNTADGWNIWIQAAPAEIDIEEMINRVPPTVMGHEDVLIALAGRALRTNQLEEAEKYARMTVEKVPRSPMALSTLALVLLSSCEGRLRHSLLGSQEQQRIDEAQHVLQRLLEYYGEVGPIRFIADVRGNRAHALVLLGRTGEALLELAVAHTVDPQEPRIALDYSRTLASQGQRLEAIRILRGVPINNDSVGCAAFLVELLLEGEPSEIDASISIIDNVLKACDDCEGMFLILLHNGIQAAFAKGDTERVHTYLMKARELDEATTRALESQVCMLQGDVPNAILNAQQSLGALTENSTLELRRYVGMLLTKCGAYREALAAWKTFLVSGTLGPETLAFLQCAHECEEFGEVLDVCQCLKDNAIYDLRCYDFERWALCACGEHSKAIELTQEYLGQQFGKDELDYLRLNLTQLGLLIGNLEVCEKDPHKLPACSAKCVRPEIGETIVTLLHALGQHSEALEFAYSLYRRYPDSMEANRALVSQALRMSAAELLMPKIVVEGTAVEYFSPYAESSDWIIIENEPNPIGSRGEYPPSHSLCASLLGKHAGDRFVIRNGIMGEEYGEVRQLLPKALYRARTCMQNMETRFGSNCGFQMVSLKGKGDEEYDFSLFLRLAENNAKRVGVLLEFFERYGVHPLPLSSLAMLSEVSVPEIMNSMTSGAGIHLACCKGSKEEFEEALLDLDNANGLVLDESAIVTLALAGKTDLLQNIELPCHVTENTLLELRHAVNPTITNAIRIQQLDRDNGQLILRPANPDTAEMLRGVISKAVDRVENLCTVTGGRDFQDLDPEMRKGLLSALKRPAAEAIALARRAGHVLWTDDAILKELARQQFGKCSRVWTQMIFQEQLRKGAITGDDYASLSLRLLQFGVEYVFVDHRVVSIVAREAQYDPADPSISLLMEAVRARAHNGAAVKAICMPLVRDAWQNCISPLRCGSLTDAVLSTLSRLPNAREQMRNLRECLATAFSLDVITGARCLAHVDTWMKTNPF